MQARRSAAVVDGLLIPHLHKALSIVAIFKRQFDSFSVPNHHFKILILTDQ